MLVFASIKRDGVLICEMPSWNWSDRIYRLGFPQYEFDFETFLNENNLIQYLYGSDFLEVCFGGCTIRNCILVAVEWAGIFNEQLTCRLSFYSTDFSNAFVVLENKQDEDVDWAHEGF